MLELFVKLFTDRASLEQSCKYVLLSVQRGRLSNPRTKRSILRMPECDIGDLLSERIVCGDECFQKTNDLETHQELTPCMLMLKLRVDRGFVHDSQVQLRSWRFTALSVHVC